MTVERLKILNEFEQNTSTETERKFIPVFPESLESFRAESRPIEQFYLSHSSEPFSLRLRETFDQNGTLNYEATLKDDGVIGPGGITRLEVTAPISEQLYHYYLSKDSPLIRKLRAEPRPGIIIDFMMTAQ